MSRCSPVQASGLLLVVLALAGCTEELPLAAPDVAPAMDVTPTALIIVTSTANDGPGSLREAVQIAPPGSTIQFAPGLAGQTIALSQRFDINQPLTIEGPLTAPVTLSGGGVTQIFSVGTDGELTLRNLVLANGHSLSLGGAIALFSTAAGVTLENSTIRNSHAAGNGGAIGGLGRITIVGSTITGNTTAASGGGIYGDSELVAVINSTISGNTAANMGGGILLNPNAEMTLFNSTVAYNDASSGGGIAMSTDAVIIGSSIVAHNANGNCLGTPGSHERSISSDGTCGFDLGNGFVDTDPLIGPLADNGGFTLTHLLLPGSPAVDGGRSDCAGFIGSMIVLVSNDQRGVARPQGESCDIGAVEQTEAMPVILTNATVDSKTGAATLHGSVQCSGPTSLIVSVSLEQAQKAGKVNTTVRATGGAAVQCTTEADWTITLTPTSGAFRNGNATATATTNADVPGEAVADLRLRWSR